MHPVTNVTFDRLERGVFQRASIWCGLAKESEINVLVRLAQKDPTGKPWNALCAGRDFLIDIVHTAQQELDHYRPLLEAAPETAPEGSLIANPKLAVETIIQAREQALRDAGEALDLITQALTIATPPHDDLAGV
jgi:hypothetical protein